MSGPFVDPDRPENEHVLAYLRAQAEVPWGLVVPPGAIADPYLQLGSHPDVVERVWGQLGAMLDPDARCVAVLGCPSLADPASGVVVGLALGTTYALRLVEQDLEEGHAAGLVRTHAYNPPLAPLDAATAFGCDWLFGAYDAREPRMVAASATAARSRRPVS